MLAAKLCDRLHYKDTLTNLLTSALGDWVHPAKAAALEVDVLQRLQWRLGPRFDLAGSGWGCCSAARCMPS